MFGQYIGHLVFYFVGLSFYVDAFASFALTRRPAQIESTHKIIKHLEKTVYKIMLGPLNTKYCRKIVLALYRNNSFGDIDLKC